jgi:hypothetical protein
MQLRDSLTKAGYGVLYPCPQSGACPLLERSRDWCYSEGQWDAPSEILRLDEMLDMDRRHLSGAGYLLASPALMEKISQGSKNQNPGVASKKTNQEAIVVGRPNRTTGPGFDYLVCQPSGLDKIPHIPGDVIIPRGLSVSKRDDVSPKTTMPTKQPLPPEKKPVRGRPSDKNTRSATKGLGGRKVPSRASEKTR